MSISSLHRRLTLTCYVIFLATLTGCVGIGGVTVQLRTNELAPPKDAIHVKIALLNEAGGVYPGSPAVGKALWTAFKAELAPIRAEEPPQTKVIDLAKSALEKAGYEVRLVDAQEASASPTPVLHIKIEEFSYEMWSYWYPYVPIEGRTILMTSIQTADGRQLDSRVFTAQGKESCWFAGCTGDLEAAMAQSLTNIMNQLIEWASNSTFRATLAKATVQHGTP